MMFLKKKKIHFRNSESYVYYTNLEFDNVSKLSNNVTLQCQLTAVISSMISQR